MYSIAISIPFLISKNLILSSISQPSSLSHSKFLFNQNLNPPFPPSLLAHHILVSRFALDTRTRMVKRWRATPPRFRLLRAPLYLFFHFWDIPIMSAHYLLSLSAQIPFKTAKQPTRSLLCHYAKC